MGVEVRVNLCVTYLLLICQTIYLVIWCVTPHYSRSGSDHSFIIVVSLSDHMANVCTKSPSLIPKFVYCTRSYLGEVEEEKMTTTTMSYECCDCEGDCTLNPDCACIMRSAA